MRANRFNIFSLTWMASPDAAPLFGCVAIALVAVVAALHGVWALDDTAALLL